MRALLIRFRRQAYLLIPFLFFGMEAYSQAQPIKIMPLGNSITQGSHLFPSYRYELWKKLIDADVNFEFVGSQSLNYNFDRQSEAPSPNVNDTYGGKTFTNKHEGHWGWRADEILNGRNGNSIASWAEAHKPDLVLLHLGTNDLFQKQSIETTLTDLRQIVGVLREKNPAVLIILAQLIPADPKDQYLKEVSEQIPLFNAQLPDLVTSLNNDSRYPDSQVVLVDQNTGFNPAKNPNSVVGQGDTYDGLHPNKLGEAKMAQVWLEAIMNEIVIPLPVELHSFKGMATQSGVQLDWETASELDNAFFEVQRGQSATEFDAIGRMEGAGTTSLPQSYTYQDKEAGNGVNYYRLRQVDFDGTQSYSPVVAVSLVQATTEEMRVYPTHTKSSHPVTVQMLALQPLEKFSISIYTLEGKLVKEYEAEADNRGNFIQLLNTAGLSDGSMYMVRASLPGRAFIRHLMIDR
ncbi:SGNH/GDSL hydrolase family protein [Pontibacter sp. BT731]|uniref:SGNH/GDSL hydrolase family protein n=1 Tax=Pontibacter coccineus TaxID=3063328 RepID=UPI0026E192AB|nr:SGNH/GDSL hydrolase family protein [Pontibacter sp. BT731]MDO6392057.1 SGNH/GDSL hydrolase family protein [Pontibacter sp. BT731]